MSRKALISFKESAYIGKAPPRSIEKKNWNIFWSRRYLLQNNTRTGILLINIV